MNKEKLFPFLEDLENRICEKQEGELYCAWKNYADKKTREGIVFTAPKRKHAPPKIEWPNIHINDALEDNSLMVLSQFKICSDMLTNGSNRLMQVRPNYGVGIMPLFFGARSFIMDRKMECLPNVRALNGYVSDIKKIIESPIPDFTQGRGPQIFDIAEHYTEIFSEFPKINKYIFPEHPDCQGAMDICELLWGSEIFVDFYEKTELVHAFLEKWFCVMPATGYHTWFGALHRGNICIRNDSAMNLSPDFYREFILPYDSEVLTKLGGGLIHFCGTGDHFIEVLSKTKGLYGVNVSQPHLNKMDTILTHTSDKNLLLICPIGEYARDSDFASHKLQYVTYHET